MCAKLAKGDVGLRALAWAGLALIDPLRTKVRDGAGREHVTASESKFLSGKYVACWRCEVKGRVLCVLPCVGRVEARMHSSITHSLCCVASNALSD